MPSGYRLEWVGEFGELQEALGRLAIAVPISLALIGMLLYVNFSSLRDTLLAASVMPMAAIGGIFALYLTGTPFSVSAAIGFVALFGISVMDGIIVLAFFNRMLRNGVSRRRCDHAHLRCPDAAGDDDLRGGLCRPAARGAFHRHRLAGPEAPGAGGRWRHAAGAGR